MVVCQEGEEIVLSTAAGMAIRFAESDARPMGRNTSGVKGISLVGDDKVVGMVVADPEATLLTACEKGYGKRTLFGPNKVDDNDDEESTSSSNRYRAQKRGGKGVRDIKTTDRNGPVIGILPVSEEDEVLLMTSKGKIQRIRCADINTIGRNTQGVRIMGLDNEDTLAVLAKVPPNDDEEGDGEGAPSADSPAASDAKPADAETESTASEADSPTEPESPAEPSSEA